MPVDNVAIPIEQYGVGRLRKTFGDPITAIADSQYRFPPYPARFCNDGNAAKKLATQDCDCGPGAEAVNNDPSWGVYGLKYCLVAEDPATKKLKPVTEYATPAAFLAEAVGVADGISHCREQPITVWQKGVIRLYLDTPVTFGVTQMFTLEVDPATTNLHMFRGVPTATAGDSIGTGAIAHPVARGWADVYFNFT